MKSLYFIDESCIELDNITRRYGHSKSGTEARSYAQRLSKLRLSLLACINISNGITYYELVDTTRGGVDAQRFAEFLKRLSLFVPSGFGVIVMDNASIHTKPVSQEARSGCGRMCLFQSPYSPDLNPIEFVFGLLKKRMQSFEYSMDNLIKITRQVLDDMTVNDIRPYILHCAKAWFLDE